MWPFTRKSNKTVTTQPTARTWPSSMWKPKGDHSLEGSEAIFGAVSLLSNTIASMNVKLMQGYREATDHPMHTLLSYKPNPRMDAFSFRQTLEACRDTAGNCYALKVRGAGGAVTALDILDPERVEPRRDTDTGDIWYVVRPADGGEWYISGQEMIHCKHVCTGGDKGVSPIRVLTDSLDYDDQMKTFSLEQVKGINGAVVLEIPSNIGKEQAANVIDNFMEHYKRSNSSLLVLSGGIKANTINRSPVDAKVLDVDRITANKVARVYSLPPCLLGDYSSSASSQQVQMEFLWRTIIPIIRMYESQLNLKLLTPEELKQGYHFVFDTDDLITADPGARADMQQKQIRSGVRTPNEIRIRNGDAPIAGGDTLMISKDLAPLDWLAKNPG